MHLEYRKSKHRRAYKIEAYTTGTYSSIRFLNCEPKWITYMAFWTVQSTKVRALFFFSTQNIIATQTTRTAFIRKCLATRSMPLPSHMQCILRDIEVFLFSFLRLFLLLIQLLFRGFCLVYGTMYVCAVCTVLLCIYVDGFDEICQHFLCHWSMWLCQLDGFFLSAFDVCRSFYSRLNCGLSLGFCFDSCVCVFFAAFLLFFINSNWVTAVCNSMLYFHFCHYQHSMSKRIGSIWLFLSAVRYYKQSWSWYTLCMVIFASMIETG